MANESPSSMRVTRTAAPLRVRVTVMRARRMPCPLPVKKHRHYVSDERREQRDRERYMKEKPEIEPRLQRHCLPRAADQFLFARHQRIDLLVDARLVAAQRLADGLQAGDGGVSRTVPVAAAKLLAPGAADARFLCRG